MTKKYLRLILVLAALTALLGCGPAKTSVTLAGSTAFQPFAEKLAEQFMAGHPGISITVQGGGSAVGVQSALSGAAQMGMADLVRLPEEARELTAVTVARDGIAVVVNPANTVANLTTAQLRDIFNGRVRNWKQVGGPDAPVTVVSREAGSGTRSSFEEIVGGIELTPDALIQDSNGTIRETVANDANAVGYLSHGLLNERIKALTIDGQACDDHCIALGRYLLVRPIFLLTRGPAQGAAADFIGYVLSPDGQATIKANGLIPAQ